MNSGPQQDNASRAAFDGLAELRASGTPVDMLPAVYQRVLAALTEAEVAILQSVRVRLQAAEAAEVEGQGLNVFI
jgi:hypothetical protein